MYLIRSVSFLILSKYWLNIQNIEYFEIILLIFLLVGSSVREFYFLKLPEAEFDILTQKCMHSAVSCKNLVAL